MRDTIRDLSPHVQGERHGSVLPSDANVSVNRGAGQRRACNNAQLLPRARHRSDPLLVVAVAVLDQIVSEEALEVLRLLQRSLGRRLPRDQEVLVSLPRLHVVAPELRLCERVTRWPGQAEEGVEKQTRELGSDGCGGRELGQEGPGRPWGGGGEERGL